MFSFAFYCLKIWQLKLFPVVCLLCRRSTDSRSPIPSTLEHLSLGRRATAADDQTPCEYLPPAPCNLAHPAHIQLNVPEVYDTLRKDFLYWSTAISNRLPPLNSPLTAAEMKDLLPSSSPILLRPGRGDPPSLLQLLHHGVLERLC